MDKAELKELFERYFEKKASPEDVQLLLRYFQLQHRESDLLQELIVEELSASPDTHLVADLKDEAVYSRVTQALHLRLDKEQQNNRGIFYQRRLLRIVASMAALLLVTTGLFLWKKSARPLLTSYAKYGQQAKVNLPDHSTVWLNAGAALVYPKQFIERERSVSLKNGDAFFQVVHAAANPFVINAGGATVTVLGTSFEISNLEKSKDITISVSTGKVGVKSANGHYPVTFVVAGQRAVVIKSTGEIHVIPVATADVAVWREQRLIFDNEPLAEAMQRLERKYNVQIKIENTGLLAERVTMRLGNQPLADVLTAISFANHFNYQKVSDQLIIVK